MRSRCGAGLVAVLMSVSCGAPASPPAPAGNAPKPSAASTRARPADSAAPQGDLAGLLGRSMVTRLPGGLVPGGDCPPPPADADQEITAQAAAIVPLKEGLTLAETWIRGPNEYECLTHVTKIDRAGVEFTMGCTNGRDHFRRRVCRSDLQAAGMLHTEVGDVTVLDASGEQIAETIVGATEFSISTAQFRKLTRDGVTPHHYVQLTIDGKVATEATGELKRVGTERLRVLVNDGPVDVPVIRAEGSVDMLRDGHVLKAGVRAAVLDDERAPMLIEYQLTALDDPQSWKLRLQYHKISYPGKIEEDLAKKKRLVVYGIYFDFNSDRIRSESEPVLKEIALALSHYPAWSVTIEGHTDDVGGDAYNLDLSRRRSDSVRRALVDRYSIDAKRLSTAGHGASVPVDTNQTPEGRARNRRVELVRIEE